MSIEYKIAPSQMASEYIELRGQHLLALMVEVLKDCGYIRLFLGCSPDPKVRSYGFYRHLGWQSTGALDTHGDEILEFACR